MLLTATGSMALSMNQCVADSPAATTNNGVVNVFNFGKYSFIDKYFDAKSATSPAVTQRIVVVKLLSLKTVF